MGDKKTAFLRCIPFISIFKNENIISTGQYMNYKKISNLQFNKIKRLIPQHRTRARGLLWGTSAFQTSWCYSSSTNDEENV